MTQHVVYGETQSTGAPEVVGMAERWFIVTSLPSRSPVVRRHDCIGGDDHSGAQTQPLAAQRSPLQDSAFGIL
jgi:hypothetical protein